jgi:hypothetical protein
LYFTADDLPHLRELKKSGTHAKIWANLAKSADWCAQQTPRTEWIPTAQKDPQYENLYDRFYAAMHDAAIVEHLAFASALSDPGDDRYFEPARKWLLAATKVWKNEAHNPPDASKAYSVLRVAKALGVGYDILYNRLSETQRSEVRDAITGICAPYYKFFQIPSNAGPGYNKHHGSVDAAPFGVAALAVLGEVNDADAWVAEATKKHADYLLASALTPSGTSEYGTTFWASTVIYRIFFCDPLKRVTGRDLFAEFPSALPGRIAMAVIADKHPASLEFNEDSRSVLFSPCYAQLDNMSPALLYLARFHQRPIYQHLALWDESLGSLQHTRYITPNKKEELLFDLGPYEYLWYDSTVKPAIEPNLPYSFEFPEPDVNSAFVRTSYEPGGIVAGVQHGSLGVHAGGHRVLIEQLYTDISGAPIKPVDEMLVADDGRVATIRCVGPKPLGIGEQVVALQRPSKLTIMRTTEKPINYWYADSPTQKDNTFTWPGGTQLKIVRGTITKLDPQGLVDAKRHYGGMHWADPHPFTYPTIDVAPAGGKIVIEITNPDGK